MKAIFYALSAFVLLINLAMASVDPEFAPLKRVLTITVGSETYEAGFMFEDGSAAYYFVPSHGDEVKVRVSRVYRSENYEVDLILDENLVSFEVKADSQRRVFQAKKAKIKITERMQGDRGPEYWNEFDVVTQEGEVRVELSTALTGAESIGEAVTHTGAVEFSPCDGCEHGDQLMLTEGSMKINLVDLNWGEYYEEDCEGTVHRLLTRLFTDVEVDGTGLGVPFTYSGLINANTNDLLEDIGEHWVADGTAGAVYIGHTTKIPVARFLDSLVYKVATALEVEAHDIWKDVMEKGEFTSYRRDVLTFSYQGVKVKTNLKTATTVVEQ